MTIRINNNSKRNDNFKYVASFPVKACAARKTGPYPVTVNPNNAEQLLHVLNALCYHPQVSSYMRPRIPSPFYPVRMVAGRYLPLEPLLNYIGGPYNIRSLDWVDPVTYTKVSEGLSVGYYDNDFVFPYNLSFTQTFIKSYGEQQWSNCWLNEPLTEFLFVNEGDNNVAAFLQTFETFFIREQAYLALCHDLRKLCADIQNLLRMELFRWNDIVQQKPLLLSAIEENSRLYS